MRRGGVRRQPARRARMSRLVPSSYSPSPSSASPRHAPRRLCAERSMLTFAGHVMSTLTSWPGRVIAQGGGAGCIGAGDRRAARGAVCDPAQQRRARARALLGCRELSPGAPRVLGCAGLAAAAGRRARRDRDAPSRSMLACASPSRHCSCRTLRSAPRMSAGPGCAPTLQARRAGHAGEGRRAGGRLPGRP